jgi:trimeric autotransporter adhesin
MAIINGTNLNNVLFGTALDDTIKGFGGEDLINGAGGADEAEGGSGNDVVFGGSGNDTLYGDDEAGGAATGNDILDGGDGDDIIDGGSGNDTIYANAGTDRVFGGNGDDEFYVHGDGVAGDVFISDTGGIDTVNFSLSNSGVSGELSSAFFGVIQTFNLDGRTVHLGAIGFPGSPAFSEPSTFENAIGSAFSDRLVGNEVANIIQGGDGDDRLFGAGGNDTLLAGAGTDYLSGGIQSTLHEMTLNSVVVGTPVSNFKLKFESFDPGGDQVPGTGTSTRVSVSFDIFTNSTDADTISETTFFLTVKVNGNATDFFIDGSQTLIQEIRESVSTDTVSGQFARAFDLIVPGLVSGGSDLIEVAIDAQNDASSGGNIISIVDVLAQQFTVDQTVTPASGEDFMDGGANGDGVTTMRGADGNDTYYIRDAADLVQENADDGIDTVQSEVNYTLGFAVENLTLVGAAVNGNGNGLDNTITGNSADNVLFGLGGNDTVIGGAGNDFIDGGDGIDAMTGGAGNDTFVVRDAGDTIVEVAGVDSGVDIAISNLVNYTLAANVERGELDAVFGTNLTGNTLDNLLTGNGGNNALNGGLGNDVMSGGFGNDTYSVSQAGDVVLENILGGTDLVVSSLAAYTLAENVENLTLTTGGLAGTGNTQDNVITGNTVANALNGGNGNDTINGGTGDDTMNGGLGNDTYVIDSSNDIIVDVSGIDTVQANFNATLQIYATVENLTLTGFAFQGLGNALGNRIVGTSLANNLVGQDGNDILEAGAGNDSLDGGIGSDRLDGGTGNDSMTGGADNDVFVVNSVGDSIVELAGGGTADRVESTITFSLAALTEVEQLTLLGAANINGTGNGLANRIVGNVGNNIIDGGLGVDIMIGGAGNDVYRIDVAGETVTELAGEGTTDRVESLITYTLGLNVENLTLLGTGNINGTGNTLFNTIAGNSGDNILNGGLGGGGDAMSGGAGNDTYVVDDAADTVTELNAGGTDLVQSSITIALGNFVENLTLTGAANIDGTGNVLANVITGNGANNTLDGGFGADTMAGGAGNDIFIVDNDLDVVSDSSGTADEVRSSVSRTLESTIERLTLTGSLSTNGTGNALANVIVGNDEANFIDGKTGADILTGGLGADTFQFTVLQNLADTITDWDIGIDQIDISASAFGGGLVAGGSVIFRFDNGIPAPVGTSGQFLFDDLTENLYFDRNGTGAGQLFHIATVVGGSQFLGNSDFNVIA